VRGFVAGLGEALGEFGMALIGGDTIALPAGTPRVLGMTALGRAGPATPSRGGGKPGDGLYLAGTIGGSAAGLAQLRADAAASGALVEAYRRPRPLIAEGRALAPHASAMMDVSDGLLIDASRMAAASDCAIAIELDALPISNELGTDLAARLAAASGGDDYALLLASPAAEPDLRNCLPNGARLSAIGRLTAGSGLSLTFEAEPVPLPETLGYEHRSA
jgi:thiamine-monophosphate kinase